MRTWGTAEPAPLSWGRCFPVAESARAVRLVLPGTQALWCKAGPGTAVAQSEVLWVKNVVTLVTCHSQSRVLPEPSSPMCLRSSQTQLEKDGDFTASPKSCGNLDGGRFSLGAAMPRTQGQLGGDGATEEGPPSAWGGLWLCRGGVGKGRSVPVAPEGTLHGGCCRAMVSGQSGGQRSAGVSAPLPKSMFSGATSVAQIGHGGSVYPRRLQTTTHRGSPLGSVPHPVPGPVWPEDSKGERAGDKARR